jgi:orotidine-5'-phosphate decarboxylase
LTAARAGFGDRLIARTRALGHPLCVGLDPYLERIPTPFRRGGMQPQHADTAQVVEEFCCRVIDLVAVDVAIVKPQVSLFECLGWRGWCALERVIRYARTAGLLVLLDAKRGDIAETATAYAQAYLSEDSECSADAITVNPYLGPESLAPFIVEADKAQRGVVVLVRNSNVDSSVYQTLNTEAGPLFTVVAASLAKWQDRLAGQATEWSSLGVTVAATHSGDTERIRTALPRALFLVLGYGAKVPPRKRLCAAFGAVRPDWKAAWSVPRERFYFRRSIQPRMLGRKRCATHWRELSANWGRQSLSLPQV